VPVEAMCAAASFLLHAVDATPARWRGGAARAHGSLVDCTQVRRHGGRGQ
jgi:hypothetical protein